MITKKSVIEILDQHVAHLADGRRFDKRTIIWAKLRLAKPHSQDNNHDNLHRVYANAENRYWRRLVQIADLRTIKQQIKKLPNL